MYWAVIMAGGNGTRFWPLSTTEHPKQFLSLIGDKTPVESCLERLSDVVPQERTYIVASESHRTALRMVLPEFPEEQILWEPIGRNTAPCIGLATQTILARDPEAVIGVFPSDHYVSDKAAFSECLKAAYHAALGKIVLLGIVPTRPETGYGYIETGNAVSGIDGVYHVASFREKPDAATTQVYFESGKFLWNSGMFIFEARVMFEEMLAYVPQIVHGIEKIVMNPSCMEDEFPRLLSISIDYAVMEHTQRAVVMKASFPWDDLGTWDSIARYYPMDKEGNAMRGKATLVDCSGVFAYAEDARRVAVLGMKDVIVVSTQDAVLVIPSERAQDVRKIVSLVE